MYVGSKRQGRRNLKFATYDVRGYASHYVLALALAGKLRGKAATARYQTNYVVSTEQINVCCLRMTAEDGLKLCPRAPLSIP